MNVGEKERCLAQMIVDYLERNPDAADTLEGIAQWWIDHERIEACAEEVAKVLEHLEQEGIITTRRIGNGNTLFRRGASLTGPGHVPMRPNGWTRS